MPVRTFHFDESGYTGYNLLDSQQPVFAISSIHLDEETASEILKYSFPKYKGSEYKFVNIWNRKQKYGFLKFSESISQLSESSFTYIIDKRFSVLVKMAEYLIEPIVYEAGYDFYADGYCWKYCDYIYFGLTQFASPALLDTLLHSYQDFSRAPSDSTLIALQRKLRLIANSTPDPLKVTLVQMADGADCFKHFHDLSMFKSSNELHISTMIAIVSYWRQRYSEDFSVIHDASSTFLRNRRMWESVTNSSVPEQWHPMGDGSRTQFPLRVSSTVPVDSKDCIQVQFCDLLAGLSVRLFSTKPDHPDRSFLEEVLDAGFGSHKFGGIFPRPDFPDSAPKKRSGPDVVDQMVEIISGSERRDL